MMAYSDKQKTKIISSIIEDIAENGKSLRAILRENKDLPSMSTIFLWLAQDEKLSEQYAHACRVRADIIFEEILDIADDGSSDTYKNEEGVELTNHEVIGRSRLRVDSRKWMLGKMNPKKYGDQSKLVLEGELKTKSEIDLSKATTEELKKIAAIADKYKKKDNE